MEGLKFFLIPIVAEPRDNVGCDTVHEDPVPDYCFKIKWHGHVTVIGFVEVALYELFRAAFRLRGTLPDQRVYGSRAPS